MVGMRDVAKEAGVSLSTVSLVVNKTGYVSDDMRARVKAAMKELNYVPNELARNLYKNRTNLVGVIVPTIRHPFFATLTAHLQRELAAQGLRTMLCSTADAENGEVEYVDMLRRHMMDGIIVCSHTTHPNDYWTSIHRPIVAFDRVLGGGIASIGSDHEQGGRLMAHMLVNTGAHHVVMIGGPRDPLFHLAAASLRRPARPVLRFGGAQWRRPGRFRPAQDNVPGRPLLPYVGAGAESGRRAVRVRRSRQCGGFPRV